jgi:hypothetical protein
MVRLVRGLRADGAADRGAPGSDTVPLALLWS